MFGPTLLHAAIGSCLDCSIMQERSVSVLLHFHAKFNWKSAMKNLSLMRTVISKNPTCVLMLKPLLPITSICGHTHTNLMTKLTSHNNAK